MHWGKLMAICVTGLAELPKVCASCFFRSILTSKVIVIITKQEFSKNAYKIEIIQEYFQFVLKLLMMHGLCRMGIGYGRGNCFTETISVFGTA
jgi:hypothetical protein